jgi:AmmeMemoRadiSam system protein A
MSDTFRLSNEEKQYLLQLARATIRNACEGRELTNAAFFSENLQSVLGVFVTLHAREELRGCIGYVQGVSPLQNAVQEMALSAAFQDPRFEPVVSDELPDVEIEISVLTPLHRIESVGEIEIGRDGIVIEQDLYRGLLLPQVATEQGWSRETFLRHTCIKAGLPPNAWMDPATKISIFSAIIFSESEF